MVSMTSAHGSDCSKAAGWPRLFFFLMNAGDLGVAIHTHGASPALAGRLRDEIGAWLPDDIEAYVDFLRAARERCKREILGISRRGDIARFLASREGYRQFSELDASHRDGWLDEVMNMEES